MSDFEIGKMLVDKGVQNGIEAYKQGRADATKELPTRLYVDGFNDGYPKGRADVIDLVIELKNKYEHFTHEEYYVSAMISDLEDLIEQLKEQK